MDHIPDRKRAHQIAADACVLGYESTELHALIDALYERVEHLQTQHEAALGVLMGTAVMLAREGDRAST